MIKKKKY